MELIPILAVALVAGILWTYALATRHLTTQDIGGEIEALQRRARWLQRRLEIARRENWEIEMISPILQDLAATQHQLARVEVRSDPR